LPGLLSPRNFWIADETRYAEVLRQMVYEGYWLVPHINGFFYPDKPPLYFWLCALVSKLAGSITVKGCLLVTGLASAGWMTVSYRLAQDLFGERKALLSLGVMMSSVLFLSCAQIVRMDALMALFVTCALRCFFLGWQQGSSRFYTLSYAFSGLAVLSKGPFGFLFVFLPAVAFLIQKRDWPALRRYAFSPFLLIPLLIVGGWLGAAWLSGYEDFVRNIFVDQIVGRSVGSEAIHAEPPYYYFIILPLVLLPWSPFFPHAIARTFKKKDDTWRFLFWWFVMGFIANSAVSGKLYLYLLPLLPPAAMVLGAFLDEFVDIDVELTPIFKVECIAAVLIAFGLPAVTPLIAQHVPWLPALNGEKGIWVFLPLGLAGLVLILKERVRTLAVLLFVGYSLLSATFFLYIAPRIDPLYSGGELSTEIAHLARQGYRVGTMGLMRGILNFHAGINTEEITQGTLEDFLNHPATVLILPQKHLVRNEEVFRRVGTKVISRYYIVKQELVVVGRTKATD
jgi:4-amino-4-deoxy-L-arabinose transferase-like glycosyltransferase